MQFVTQPVNIGASAAYEQTRARCMNNHFYPVARTLYFNPGDSCLFVLLFYIFPYLHVFMEQSGIGLFSGKPLGTPCGSYSQS
jgi:hypothetical protein